jgi:hypothetical protein
MVSRRPFCLAAWKSGTVIGFSEEESPELPLLVLTGAELLDLLMTATPIGLDPTLPL